MPEIIQYSREVDIQITSWFVWSTYTIFTYVRVVKKIFSLIKSHKIIFLSEEEFLFRLFIVSKSQTQYIRLNDLHIQVINEAGFSAYIVYIMFLCGDPIENRKA